jgi:hypothetical protein
LTSPEPGRLWGEAVLALWGDGDPAQDEGFNDWYTHEHLPERIAIPGFLRARRYVADLPGPPPTWRYFTLYETASLAVLQSPEYLHALNNPTAGTRRYMALMAGLARTACRVVHSSGKGGEGGNLAFVEFAPEHDELVPWITSTLVGRVLARSGTLGVHLARMDPDTTAARDRTEVYREVPTTVGRWLLLVEGAWVDLAAARTQLESDTEDLRRHGADIGGKQLFRALAQLTAGTPAWNA